jgi:hypothetical protein
MKITVQVPAGREPVRMVDVKDGGLMVVRPPKVDRKTGRDTGLLYPGDAPVEVDDCRYIQRRIAVGDLAEVKAAPAASNHGSPARVPQKKGEE